MAASRAPYDAGTPDRDALPQAHPDGMHASSHVSENMPLLQRRPVGYTEKAQDTWRVFAEKSHEVWANNTGMLLVAASEAFFACMNLSVKILNRIDPPVTTMELVWVRMVITWLCSVSYMYMTQIPDPILGPKGVRGMLTLRGLGGFCGLFGVYYPLQYLSLADTTVLSFLAPILTTFTGAWFLGEGYSLKQVVAGLCSLFGVVLIARPAVLFGQSAGQTDAPLPGDVDYVTPAQRLGAIVVALLGAFGATLAYTSIRAIGKRAHTLHNLVYFSSTCIVVSSISMIATRTEFVIPTRITWLGMLLMIGLFGFVAQILMTLGLQKESAGRATMAIYIQVVYAIAFDVIIFHSPPSLLSILGTLVIISSAIFVAISKRASPTKGHAEAEPIEEARLREPLMGNQSRV